MKINLNKQTKNAVAKPLSNSDLTETAYLLRSLANAEHLNKSIAQFKAGNMFKRKVFKE